MIYKLCLIIIITKNMSNTIYIENSIVAYCNKLKYNNTNIEKQLGSSLDLTPYNITCDDASTFFNILQVIPELELNAQLSNCSKSAIIGIINKQLTCIGVTKLYYFAKQIECDIMTNFIQKYHVVT